MGHFYGNFIILKMLRVASEISVVKIKNEAESQRTLMNEKNLKWLVNLSLCDPYNDIFHRRKITLRVLFFFTKVTYSYLIYKIARHTVFRYDL